MKIIKVLFIFFLPLFIPNLGFADDDEFVNKDIFAPWNDTLQKDDIFAPWNDPIADKDDTNEYMRDNDVSDEDYYWD